MHRFCLILCSIFLLTVGGFAANNVTGQWIVVTAPEFRDCLAPLEKHRRSEGMNVRIIQTTDVLTDKRIQDGEPAPLRDHVHEICRKCPGPVYLLLFGSVRATNPERATDTVVPPLCGKTGRMKGRPTDNAYGCLSESMTPEIPVGRLPARNKAEAKGMIEKIMRFERNDSPGPWNHRLFFAAGHPGGSSFFEKRLAEYLIQMVGRKSLRKVHPFWKASMIFHAQKSPFYVSTDSLHETVKNHLRRGQIFSFYLGHSGTKGLFSDRIYFMKRPDWDSLKISGTQGVFFTCGCHGCQLNGKFGQGYGLNAIRNPGGPAAVIGPSGESFGAMGQLAFEGMIKCLEKPEPPLRLGDYWNAVKKGIAEGEMSRGLYYLYDQADGSCGEIPMDVQRLTHLEMWMLLGDPAMKLPLPRPDISLESVKEASPGEEIIVKGELPPEFENASIKLTLERPLGWGASPADSVQGGGEESAETLERANRFVLASYNLKVKNGGFGHRISAPETLPWPRLILRACAANENRESMGVITIPVKTPSPAE